MLKKLAEKYNRFATVELKGTQQIMANSEVTALRVLDQHGWVRRQG